MTFKEQIKADNEKIFLNLQEFSDYHIVNGKKMAVQVDNNEMVDREKRYMGDRNKHADGVFLKQLLIYVRAEEFGALPAIGRQLLFDNKSYTITDAIDEDGIYSISMEANKTTG